PSPTAAPVEHPCAGLRPHERERILDFLCSIGLLEHSDRRIGIFVEISVESCSFVCHIFLSKNCRFEIERQKRNCPSDISPGQSLNKECGWIYDFRKLPRRNNLV